MPAFFTAAHLKLSILLAVLGTLIALIFTILSSSGATALIVRPLVSGLLMFILGSVIYALLAKKVPEAIEVIENHPDVSSDMMADAGMGESDLPGAEGGGGASEDYSGAEGQSSFDAYDSGSGPAAVSSIPRKTGVQIGKEEIVVNGVKFKNQPEVMAETIKQLMDQDKE
jgi:hypothetical protein